MPRDERDYSHRSLIDKLGVRPDDRVYLCSVSNRALAGLVRERTGVPASGSLRGRYDVIFYEVGAESDLDRIPVLATHLQPAGALWIFHPKGKGALPSDAHVRASALASGLVDNKICGYTQTHAATRYVIRKELRREKHPGGAG
jgi:hypothetical protein